MTHAARSVALLVTLLVAACEGSPVVGGSVDASDDLSRADVTADAHAPPDVMKAPDVAVDAEPPRCASNADCPGRACDTAAGRCVECVTSDDACPADRHCDGATHTCVPGCRADEGCRATSADGGTAGPAQRCDPARHECVACVTDGHCPPGNLCVGNLCVTGCNDRQPCPTGRTCCDGACVETDSNRAHCGGCGMQCALAGASPGCNNGHCVVSTCNDGLGDCDLDPTNGCEVDVRATVAHCGGCGMACAPRANAAPTCDARRCVYACATGFADCDGDASNGCEVDTRASVAHCGACRARCEAPNGVAACAAGACAVASCTAGFADCNGSAVDGCEVDTRTTVAHCGGCGRPCAARTGSLAACVGGSCAYACVTGSGDCNGLRDDGCEVDLATSELHCGACGRSCVTAGVATARCADARCQIVACATGFADCDGDASNGCETDTRASNAHCGACRMACAAGTACSAGACRSTCAAGETFCAGRCVDTRAAPADCGSCGNVCPDRPSSSPACST
jgi:hypothetical protein